MNAAVNAATSIDSFRPEHIPPEEWRARVDLAACYRLHAHYGWTDLIYTHIPCVVCNQQIKFKDMLDTAAELGA